MTTLTILQILQRDIHSTVFATVDDDGLPQTCVIDLMLADEGGLYFLTAKGKRFYERLQKRGFVALSGMKGKDTLSTVAISLRGRVKSIGQRRLDEIFAQNPYMERLYATRESRSALEVFQLYEGEGEYFDLGQSPVYRQGFAFGGAQLHQTGYRIRAAQCIGCECCRSVCPAGCISGAIPRRIDPARCLHCGNCLRACPAGAVEKLG